MVIMAEIQTTETKNDTQRSRRQGTGDNISFSLLTGRENKTIGGYYCW